MAPLFAPHHCISPTTPRLNLQDGIALLTGDGIVSHTFAGNAEQIPAVRHWALAHLPGGRQHTAATEVELAVCELATNAIRHSRSGDPGGIFQVALAVSPWVFIGVYDQGGPSVPAPQSADLTAQSGRGLAMLTRLALSWGTHRADFGRLVWCIVSAT